MYFNCTLLFNDSSTDVVTRILAFVYIQIIPNGEEMVPAALYLAEAMLANPIVVSADN